MKIYVVIGSSGEYSDRREWMAKAFKHEEDAQVLVMNATKRADEIYHLAWQNDYCFWKIEEGKDPAYINEYDPKMDILGLAEVRYHYEAVELVNN